MIVGGVLEVGGGMLGAVLGGLLGLSIAWVIALSIQALIMAPTVYRAIVASPFSGSETSDTHEPTGAIASVGDNS